MSFSSFSIPQLVGLHLLPITVSGGKGVHIHSDTIDVEGRLCMDGVVVVSLVHFSSQPT